MQYNQPYGVTDPNAGYINGNPQTGTAGSIPPAASIEYPQRELVNFIADSGIGPANNDLSQLAKSVQNGRVNWGQDQGSPNYIAITPTPAVVSLVPGLHFRIMVMNVNTGPVYLNVSNLGWLQVVHGDKSPMGGGELYVYQIIDVAFDGSQWQMMTGGVGGGLIFMTAPRTVYVNPNNGNDSAYDGSQPTISGDGLHGPFLTIGHALNVMTKFNLGGWSFNIVCADGVYYQSEVLRLPLPNGSGTVWLIGNHNAPQNCKIYNNNAGSCWFFESGGNWQIDGFSFQTNAGAYGDPGNCIWTAAHADLGIGAVAFFNCSSSHMSFQDASTVRLTGPDYIFGGAGAAHIYVANNAIFGCFPFSPGPPPLIIETPVNIGAFAYADQGGVLDLGWAYVSNFGYVSGKQYFAGNNGVISSGGGGAGSVPGNIAGNTANGGQFS